MVESQLTTGLPALDRVFKGLLPGDNIVWRVDSTDDCLPFVQRQAESAVATGRRLIYFRYGKHQELVPSGIGAEMHCLHPEDGFEKFISDIHKVIRAVKERGCYIFDCLSDLAVDWCSDRMLGNFFTLTCPYVLDVEGLAHFSLLKNYHSEYASATIAKTTQILVDVYRHKTRLYIHPIKVHQRHSATMHMLHVMEKDTFRPVSESATIAEILNASPYAGAARMRSRLGIWPHTFMLAEESLAAGRSCERCEQDTSNLVRRLLRMAVSREDRMLCLAEKFLNLQDILKIRNRMIGTGLIGGKSVGMLLARAILEKHDPRWKDLLETHDSFFIGSDVFYSYLVENGCWWIREKQKNPATFLDGAEDTRRRILTGTFSADIENEFARMLEYFGQSPIIVRSSSLLEDAFGNSFAGKYESIFCVNQGSREKRLSDFMAAVRTIYASTMSERALRYRERRNMLDRDEQMSLLVQRVSGSLHGTHYYPHVAGVGLSYNPYSWNEQIDPKAGILRLVFGLGTRAVDRSDDDYTRVISLSAPERRPESNFDEVRRYTQRRVDTLDLEANQLVSNDFVDVARQSPDIPLRMFASRDAELERLGLETGVHDMFPWVLTFEQLLSDTLFVKDMHEMLKVLEQEYDCPVDVEFTTNFLGKNNYKINVVQCRPLQVKGDDEVVDVPSEIESDKLVLEAKGAVVGCSRSQSLDRLIFVVPSVYGQLPINDRYSVARLIGRLMHLDGDASASSIMILGPGRWGTTTPSLGVPVSFPEINKASILCEIVAMREGLVPDVSLGTHFFNELVETDMLYLALFPGREGNQLNEAFFSHTPNKLKTLVPESADRSNVVVVIDAADLPDGLEIKLRADNHTQQVVCFLESQRPPQAKTKKT